MKALLALLLAVSPAFAQNMSQMGMWAWKQAQFEAAMSPRDRAVLACFQNAPWVVPPNYYDRCLAATPTPADRPANRK